MAASVRAPNARDALASFGLVSENVPTFRVLIAHLDQLHNFVQRIPPLAWELLEYATEPLEIVYPERKPALAGSEMPTSICIRWVKQPRLLRLVQQEGPLWAVRPQGTILADASPWKKVDCSDKKYPYQRVKTVVVAADGTFSFLR